MEKSSKETNRVSQTTEQMNRLDEAISRLGNEISNLETRLVDVLRSPSSTVDGMAEKKEKQNLIPLAGLLESLGHHVGVITEKTRDISSRLEI